MKLFTICSCDDNNNNYLMKIVNSFVEGVTSTGNEVILESTRDMKLYPCRGCTDDFHFESKGYCYCEDDMNKLYPIFRFSDIWIFAVSVRKSKPHKAFRDILDRMEPLFDPFHQLDNHYVNGGIKDGKVVLIGVSEDWSIDTFNLLEDHMKDFSAMFNREFAGSLLRPHSLAMDISKEYNEQIINSAKNLGNQLVINRKFNNEDLKKLSKTIIDRESYSAYMKNASLQTA